MLEGDRENTQRNQGISMVRPKLKGMPWQDQELSHVDNSFLYAFPSLFVLFNAIYWATVINGGQSLVYK